MPSAIAKAAALVSRLHEALLPSPEDSDCPLPARLTVTAIDGGQGYSTVPDLCTVSVDVRLTPAWDSDAALATVCAHTAAVDTQWSDTGPTGVEVTTRWSAFALPPDSPLGAALLKAAEAVGVLATSKVAGPSNVGNYLAGLGIPATVGFGVARVGLHGSDERIGLASIPLVQATCHQALLRLLAVS